MSGITYRERIPGTDKFGEPVTVFLDPLPPEQQILILTEAVTGLSEQVMQMQVEIDALKGSVK